MVIHTPYDGSSAPFTIGLKQLDFKDWIEIDATFDAQMAEKRRVYTELPNKVFVAEAGTEDAQQEVLDLLQAHVLETFPERFHQTDDGIEIAGNPDLSLSEPMPPLKIASLLVQEDLILMRKGEDGWRLAAGSLCFPSSWTLTEKFGKPLHRIHEPVPGFGPGTRNDGLISRMFDNLQLGRPVYRFNWSVQAGDALYHPLSNEGRIDRAEQRPSKFGDADLNAAAFIRVERQTLRKLPQTGDILFTIRIYLDPLGMLASHPDRATLAPAFAAQLLGLSIEELDYKGLTADRDRLVAALEAIAAE
jgi:hypothetical protein